MRSYPIQGGLVALFLLIAVVVAQETPTPRNGERNAAGENLVDPEGQRAADVDPATMKPIDHFLAGYYAGYADGYLDGGEDTVAAAAGRHTALARKHAEDGQHPDEMQPGRREARESLRAHMREEDEEESATGQQREGQDSEAAIAEETVSGTVVGMKEVPITGTDIVHRVVRLETEDGRRHVADLGPTDQTDKLGIQEGDQLRVKGVPAMTPDLPIIAGHRIFKGDQEAHVHYPGLKVSDENEPRQPRERPADEGAGRSTDAPSR